MNTKQLRTPSKSKLVRKISLTMVDPDEVSPRMEICSVGGRSYKIERANYGNGFFGSDLDNAGLNYLKEAVKERFFNGATYEVRLTPGGHTVMRITGR